MKTKLEQLNQAIIEKVNELGMIFVSGPSGATVPPLDSQPDVSEMNGQDLATYLFCVTDKPAQD